MRWEQLLLKNFLLLRHRKEIFFGGEIGLMKLFQSTFRK